MAGAIPCGPYTCVESPVDWFTIDVLALITVLWIVFTFFYKGVRQFRVARFPQIVELIPYPEWESRLLGGPRRWSLGAFFKTIFSDALAMNILKCEYGKSAAEVVRTRTAVRVAKLLMVWGFVFAGISTIVAYFTFPHNMIVLNFTTPARIFGMIAGVFLIAGSLLWISVRYKEVNYKGVWDWLGAEYLPFLVFLIGLSGFVLQAAILAYAAYPNNPAVIAFLYFAIHFHAIPVALFFWAFFWTNADHIIYRIIWRMDEYGAKAEAGARTRLPPTDIKPLNRTGKEIPPGY